MYCSSHKQQNLLMSVCAHAWSISFVSISTSASNYLQFIKKPTMPPPKGHKSVNFASAGRVLGIGEVKPARKTKSNNKVVSSMYADLDMNLTDGKDQAENDDADFIPEADTASESAPVEKGTPTGRQRKHQAETGNETEAGDDGSVAILARPKMRMLCTKSSDKALQAARARLVARYQRNKEEAKAYEVGDLAGIAKDAVRSLDGRPWMQLTQPS